MLLRCFFLLYCVDSHHLFAILFLSHRRNTLRKSLFTISAVLFAPAGVMMQTWAALVLLLLFVAVFSLSRPYEQNFLNHLERGALTISIVTLLCGLGLFTNEQTGQDARSKPFAEFLTFVIVATNLVFVLNVLRTFFQHTTFCAVCFQRCQRAETKHRSVAVVPATQTSVVEKEQHLLTAYKLQQNILAAMNQRLTFAKKVKEQKITATTPALSNSKLLSRVKSQATRTAEQVQQKHIRHRNSQIKKIKQQQSQRRSSVQARVAARRKKAKTTNALQNCSIFSELDTNSVAAIVDKMDYEIINEGTEICTQGDVADILYIILSGSCTIVLDNKNIASLHELDIFGESAINSDVGGGAGGSNLATRGATVVAATDVQLLCLSNKKFQHLLESKTLNEDCLVKLRFVAEQRAAENAQQGERKTGDDAMMPLPTVELETVSATTSNATTKL